MHALDYRETFRELGEGCIYLWERMRGHDPERRDIRRVGDLEVAFGKERSLAPQKNTDGVIDPCLVNTLDDRRRQGRNRRHKKWNNDDAWDIADRNGIEEPGAPLTPQSKLMFSPTIHLNFR